mmetsp:Transcript_27332/g.78713  ORF Transcript_27332/g.78713 Transcript_27332/m.78713 type:complete len:265 (+) Transcript_27332:359-1153(+)
MRQKLPHEPQRDDGAHLGLFEGADLLQEAAVLLQATEEHLRARLVQQGLRLQEPILEDSEGRHLAAALHVVMQLREQPGHPRRVRRPPVSGGARGAEHADGAGHVPSQREEPLLGRLEEAQPKRLRDLEEKAHLLAQGDLHGLLEQRVEELLELSPPLLDELRVLLPDPPLRRNGRQPAVQKPLHQLQAQVVELRVAAADGPDLPPGDGRDAHGVEGDRRLPPVRRDVRLGRRDLHRQELGLRAMAHRSAVHHRAGQRHTWGRG